jgi:hypothetical protein
MSTTEIRETLHEVATAVPAPPVDRVAFHRELRRQRRSRAAMRLAVAGVSAAAVVVAGTAIAALRTDGIVREGSPATPAPSGPGLSEVLPLVVDGELMAVDPAGTVHDLGLRSEDLVGFTTEMIVALDDDSHVVVKTIARDDEGVGTASFADAPSPVTDSVSSVQMSSDGRYLAWLTIDDRLHVHDLKAGRSAWTAAVPANSYVAAVAARGVLLSEDGDLVVLEEGGGRTPVPTQGDGYGWVSDLAVDRVAVVDRDERTRVYDVSTGEARQESVLDGAGALAPYAAGVVSLVRADDDSTTVEVWDGRASRKVTGYAGTAEEVAWVQDGSEDGSILVTSRSPEGVALFACSPADLTCTQLPVLAEDSITVG